MLSVRQGKPVGGRRAEQGSAARSPRGLLLPRDGS